MLKLYRISHWLYNNGFSFITPLIEVLIYLMFNSRIPSSVKIGKSSYFAYKGLSTLLVKGTVIGDNCSIGMRVTTGRNFPYKEVPNIGNRVWIGTNSVIIGQDNVIIAPNSFVNKSIPEGVIVAGNPAKIIGWVKDLDYNIFDCSAFIIYCLTEYKYI